jgi:hypothetical protein
MSTVISASAPAIDLAAVKARQQAAWSTGNYAVVGTTLQIVGENLCEALDLRSGSRVLDVAAGNGNATLAAARRWCDVVAGLPRRQTRVLTWPVVTVLGFIAQPQAHIFLKPTVTREAARRYGTPFHYQSRPSWETYASLLALARAVRKDLRDLRPRDMIDAQSFLWIQGSDEYPD